MDLICYNIIIIILVMLKLYIIFVALLIFFFFFFIMMSTFSYDYVIGCVSIKCSIFSVLFSHTLG